MDKLGKLLKKFTRKELLRNNKIRLYVTGEFKEEEALSTERMVSVHPESHIFLGIGRDECHPELVEG